MPDLLLELFSEEIPARMQQEAARDLERLMSERLLAAGFLPEGVKAFAGPRRLVLIATGLPARQPDRQEEKKGPRVGAPEKAIEGFLKSAGFSSLDQCATLEDKKGRYYVARTLEKGRETSAVLADAVQSILREFPWPKSMRWGDGDLRWVRPLKSVLCCFNDEIVPFEIGGVRAGDTTQGHRRFSSAPIHARNFDKYVPALTTAKVMVDGEARAALIAADAKTLCEAQGLELVEDKGLLAEVAGLAEWPVVMMGSFDRKFLALPDEVLTAAMRGHQKYFSVIDPKTGRLAPKFVFVANIDAADGGVSMRKGYERVLTARLSDAWYLYRQDLNVWESRKSINEFVEPLSRVTFFEGLGSIGHKARRVADLAGHIAPMFNADARLSREAALLAKADLTTGMVYEFPELQGVMGRYYYLAQHAFVLRDAGLRPAPQDEGMKATLHPEEAPAREGAQTTIRPHSRSGAVTKDAGAKTTLHPEERAGGARHEGSGADISAIADAIRDHYAPKGDDDPAPIAPVSVAVALADKFDTLTAFWVIGKKPTGSGDPYALRRAALGIIRILIDCGQSMMLTNVVGRLLREEHGIQFYDPRHEELTRELLEFFHARMKAYFQSRGFQHDHVAAALIASGGRLEERPYQIVRKLEALEAFLKTDDGANLAAGYKRAANILKAEEKKESVGRMKSAGSGETAKVADFIRLTVDEKLLQQTEEKTLHAALRIAEADAAAAVAAENFADAMTALAALRAPIDAFFDKVTVNDADPARRANRLALLQRFVAATASVADLSKLAG